MKKILLGTTAVVALGAFTTEAFAADKIALGLGGFLRDYVSYSNHDEAVGANKDLKLGQFQNGEVYVTGNTTLDNGIKVAARIEMEASGENQGTNNNDRVFMTLSSDQMGLLRLGVAAHMMDDHAVRAPMVGPADWGDIGDYVQFNGTGNANSSALDIAGFGDNAIKIGYQSPEFAGATIYASYGVAEGSGGVAGRSLARNATHDSATFGVAYSGEMGGASVSADVGQAIFRAQTNGAPTAGSSVTDGMKVTRAGVNVGMAGFTIGGGYQTSNGDSAATAAVASLDGNAWELGASYETGPYSVAAAYMRSKVDGLNTAGSDKWTAYQAGFGYDMGAGVGLVAQYVYSKQDDEATAATSNTSASALIAGVEIGF
ncbi:porin [Pseudomonadota bacterium]